MAMWKRRGRRNRPDHTKGMAGDGDVEGAEGAVR